MEKTIGLLLLMTIAFGALGQTTEEEYEANYNKRIKLEIINGVYIPLDLDDAFSELERLSDKEGVAKFRKAPENEIRRRLHFGLGRWILINWGLEDGSRYSHYLREMGIANPDDMVRLTIVSWHRSLNGKPLQLQEEIAIIAKRVEAEKAKRDAEKEIIVIEKRPHKED